MKKTQKNITILILMMSLSVLGVGGFYIVRAMKDQSNGGSGVIQGNQYFNIRKNATAYQKKVYDELVASMNQELVSKEVAGLIAQNYVADFYTWTNKLKINDVGGIQYIHHDMQSWVYGKALDSFYNDMYYYLKNGSISQSLEVLDTTVSNIKEVEIEMEKDAPLVQAYELDISWSYQDSDVVSISKYQNQAQLVLTQDSDGILSIVKVSGYEKISE